MNRTIAILVVLAAVGCKQSDTTAAETPPAEPGPAAMPADQPATAPTRPTEPPKQAARDMPADEPAAADKAAPAAEPAADNTGKNERDQDTAALTPTDQGENEVDRTITQQARAGVVGADQVSMSGKNVKIITVDRVVTLRGPVESAQEKKQIASIVKRVDGVKRVDNQLEIASK